MTSICVNARQTQGRRPRILDNVVGNVRVSLDDLDEEVVVFANDLTPSDTATMDMNYVKGFVTQLGGRTSHTSIIARIMGLPAIVGTGRYPLQGEALAIPWCWMQWTAM